MLDALRDHIALMGTLADLEEQVERAAQAIARSINGGGKVLVFGNGGSAADAAHFAAELVGRFKQDRPALPALALTSDGPLVTAIGNDYGVEMVFRRQLQAWVDHGDAVIAITTTGKSKNVVRGLEVTGGACSIGLLGRDGGECVRLCDIPIIVPGHDTARIQEAHGFLLHVICARVEELVI